MHWSPSKSPCIAARCAEVSAPVGRLLVRHNDSQVINIRTFGIYTGEWATFSFRSTDTTDICFRDVGRRSVPLLHRSGTLQRLQVRANRLPAQQCYLPIVDLAMGNLRWGTMTTFAESRIFSVGRTKWCESPIHQYKESETM